MKICPECVPCLMKRVLFQSEAAGNGKVFESVSAALKTYASLFESGSNSAAVATEVHRASYAALGVRDPYLELKIRADAVAEGMLPAAESYIERSDDRFRASIMMAVIGNIMDFGSGIKAIDDPDEFGSIFEDLASQGIGADDTEKFRSSIRPGGTVLYMFDNCGESQLDKLLIREIRSMGARVVGIARGEPILNDVTEEDALRIGLDRELDRLLTSGQFAIGLDLSKIGPELREELADADLLVAKGMANFEALSDQDAGVPVVHIMRSKCMPVARAAGVPYDTNVVLYRPKQI